MDLKKTLLIIISIQASLVFGQFNPERIALRKISKGEWLSARQLLNKSLRKDSLHIEAAYAYSLLFIHARYHQFNADSAHYFYLKTQRLFELADTRRRSRLRRFPIDSIILTKLNTKIDSIAFEKAKTINTEEEYIHFITYYPDASQNQQAVQLRDETAFVIALMQNSHLTLDEFLRKYPNSHRSNEARQRFEKLLFEFSTKNKSLNEYREFVSRNPSSPFSIVALKNIYEMVTEDGQENSFNNFIEEYSHNPYTSLSKKILFHLQLQSQATPPLSDSLKTIYPLRDWMPFTENNQWGFMDETGKVTMPASLSGLHEKYFCSALSEDFILTNSAIMARDKAIIIKGKFNDAEDLGAGFILIKRDSVNSVMHKSGWNPNLPPALEAVVISSRFIAVKNSSGWGLFALNGKQLTPFSFDKVVSRAGFVIFSKLGKEILVPLNQVIAYSRGNWDAVVADEIKAIGGSYIWLRNGALEKILDENLKEIIPFDRHHISYSAAGLLIKKNESIKIKGWPQLENEPLVSAEIIEPWLITRRVGAKLTLFHIPTKREIASSADSIWFDQSFAAVRKNDSLQLWQPNLKSFNLPLLDNYSIRRSKDSIVFILISSKSKTTVLLASNFKKLFITPFHDIEPLLKNIFLIREMDKQGLLNEKGKIILKPEYHAILFSDGIFSLLKDKKFGSYNPSSKKILKPTYDSNLKRYGKWIIARKGTKLGFLTFEGKGQTGFDFDEINFWSDTVALILKGGKNSLYSISTGKNIVENITAFQAFELDSGEQLALFRQNSLYGLLGKKSGVIIEPEFEELTYQTINNVLILIGVKQNQEGMLEVVYFQSSGKVIRKQILSKEIGYSLLCDD